MTFHSRQSDLTWRWIILGMLFVSTFLNYLDRQTLSVLKPTIKAEFSLDDNGYANIVSAFLVTYMIAYTLGGRFVDRVGSRLSMTLFVGVWSAATFATGLAGSVVQLMVCRCILGAAEPGNYPAALRVTATWFPADRRGLASSLYQAGSATAAVLAVPIVAGIASFAGWRAAFILPGAIGLVWTIAWWRIYRSPSPDYMPPAPDETKAAASWWCLLRERNLWAVVLARLLTDQAWYFCLFWVPGYLQENMGLTLVQAGLIGWVPFLCADISGVVSGLTSDRLVRRGLRPWRARRGVIVAASFAAPAVVLIPWAPNNAVALGAFCVLASVCQIWLFNLTTLVADTFPRTSVASVLGISGSFGAFGGILSSKLIGVCVGTLGYGPVFIALGAMHLIGAAILCALLRDGERSPSATG